MKRVLAASLLLCFALAAGADSGTALERYLSGLTSLRATFTQNVTDTQGKQSEDGSGSLLVQRPGKFRWDYHPSSSGPSSSAPPDGHGADASSGQLLVADGRNVWFYDRELAQVTVKPVTQALSATPVMLLSGTPAQLHDTFDIAADGTHDGMDWVRVTPRSSEADFSVARLGFVRDQLTRMLVNDRLGQTVQMDFSHIERNGRVNADELQFKAPAGVDVIGAPQ